MTKSNFRMIPVTTIILAMLFTLIPHNFASADNSKITITAQYRQDVPITLDTPSASEVSSLDPALATDNISISAIENLFLGLTDANPVTTQIVPELATDWSVSADGLVWTFNLRDDVNWMRYDPGSETAEEIRPVTADDFVFGIKRACDPRLGGFYGTIAAGVIAGCDIVNQSPSEEVSDELVYGDTIGVTAPDDTTLIIELQFSAGYFFSMTPMWMLHPVPQETIAEFGDNWTQPGNIVTNGPYFVSELTRGIRRSFVRNDALPLDLRGGDGNIEVINTSIIEDIGMQFALFQDAQLDTSNIPAAELQNVLGSDQFQNQVLQIFDLTVFYFGYAFDKAPFDNVNARQAFSAVIDRQAFVEQVRSGRGVPMIHFTPPGLAHAAPINEIGVGFDPAYAAERLAEAGYPNCEGFPTIDIVTFSGAGNWADFWAAGAEEHLGCDPSLLNVEQLEFSVLLEITDPEAPTQDRPNAWTLGWGPDYPDANNFLFDVISCSVDNRLNRACTEVDDLMELAASETDPLVRDELYAEIEDAFFGAEGEFPIAPIFLRSDFILVQTWYTGPFETDGLFGGAHWGARSIDMAAKLAARG